jgi:hypothetical protein
MFSNEQTLNTMLIWVARIATIVMCAPFIIAVFKNKELNKSLRIFRAYWLVFLIISIFTQLLIWLIYNKYALCAPYLKMFKIRNLDFISIFAHLNVYIGLSLYFACALRPINEKLSKRTLYISGFLAITSLANYFFIEGHEVQSVFNSTAATLFCIVLPMIHLTYLYKTDSVVPLQRNPYFWIGLGVMIPNLLSLIVSTAGQKIQETDKILFLQTNLTQDILVTIIQVIFFSQAFLLARYSRFLD